MLQRSSTIYGIELKIILIMGFLVVFRENK